MLQPDINAKSGMEESEMSVLGRITTAVLHSTAVPQCGSLAPDPIVYRRGTPK